MADPMMHLDSDTSPEFLERHDARMAEVPPVTLAKLREQFAGDRSAEFYQGMLQGMSAGYQLTPPGSLQQGQLGLYIIYLSHLALAAGSPPPRATDT